MDRRILVTAQKLIVKVHHHQSSVFRHELQYLIVNIPTRIAQTECRRMREYYRGLGNCQHVPHCLYGRFRQIHSHAETIHFTYDNLAVMKTYRECRRLKSWKSSHETKSEKKRNLGRCLKPQRRVKVLLDLFSASSPAKLRLLNFIFFGSDCERQIKTIKTTTSQSSSSARSGTKPK